VVGPSTKFLFFIELVKVLVICKTKFHRCYWDLCGSYVWVKDEM